MIEVWYVRCCKVWPVAAFTPWARCGVCGVKPKDFSTKAERDAECRRRGWLVSD